MVDRRPAAASNQLFSLPCQRDAVRPQPLCLPCQREVARPQAVTEGLFYGQMPFQRSDVTEKFFFFELRLPGTSASFYAIPRSPLSPPLTRGPNQPANVPAAAGSGGMRASRPTVAQVVAAAPVSRSVLPPLSKGGGTAAGRDGGIVLRPDAVSKKRHNGRITLPLTTSSGNDS